VTSLKNTSLNNFQEKFTNDLYYKHVSGINLRECWVNLIVPRKRNCPTFQSAWRHQRSKIQLLDLQNCLRTLLRFTETVMVYGRSLIQTFPHPGTSTPSIGLGISRERTTPYLLHSSRMSSRMSSYSSSSRSSSGVTIFSKHSTWETKERSLARAIRRTERVSVDFLPQWRVPRFQPW